jgi:hypothetical protein
MKINFYKIFRKLNRKEYFARKDLLDLRSQWVCLENSAERIFKQVIEQGKESGFWENLYIDKSPKDFKKIWNGKKYRNFNMIALCMGNHATDIVYEDFAQGKVVSLGIVAEKGGALLISQMINGAVAVFLYPSKSDIHNSKVAPKLLKIFKRPLHISDDYIEKCAKHMLIYSHDTSYTGFYPRWKYLWELVIKYRRDILFLFIGAFISLLFSVCYQIFFQTKC